MNNIEETIINLINIKNNKTLNHEHIEAINVAISVMYKQIPANVCTSDYEYCPTCFRKVKPKNNYCGWCGQRIITKIQGEQIACPD